MLLDKEKLKKDGYLAFNLKDIDSVLYNSCKTAFNKNELINFIESFRADGRFLAKEDFSKLITPLIEEFGFNEVKLDLMTHGFQFKARKSSNKKLEQLVEFENILDTIVKKYNQKWYYQTLPPEYHSDLIKQIFENTFCKLYEAEFENFIEELYSKPLVDVTMFRKSNFIENHSDGYNENTVCAFLMYLNDDYSDGVGGELKIGDVVIKPIFGTIVILDFINNNPPHEVLPVTDDNFLRFAFTKFPQKTKKFLEKQKMGVI